MNFFKAIVSVFLVCATSTFFITAASAELAAPGREICFFVKGMTASYNRKQEARAIPLKDLGGMRFSFDEATLEPGKGVFSKVMETLENLEMASLYGGLVSEAWPTLPDSAVFHFAVDLRTSLGQSLAALHLDEKSVADQRAFIELMQAEWKSVEGQRFADNNKLIIPVYIVALGIEREDIIQESTFLPDGNLSLPARELLPALLKKG